MRQVIRAAMAHRKLVSMAVCSRTIQDLAEIVDDAQATLVAYGDARVWLRARLLRAQKHVARQLEAFRLLRSSAKVSKAASVVGTLDQTNGVRLWQRRYVAGQAAKWLFGMSAEQKRRAHDRRAAVDFLVAFGRRALAAKPAMRQFQQALAKLGVRAIGLRLRRETVLSKCFKRASTAERAMAKRAATAALLAQMGFKAITGFVE
jgi:hypothetical protein